MKRLRKPNRLTLHSKYGGYWWIYPDVTLREARKLHEWAGRLVAWLEAKEKR